MEPPASERARRDGVQGVRHGGAACCQAGVASGDVSLSAQAGTHRPVADVHDRVFDTPTARWCSSRHVAPQQSGAVLPIAGPLPEVLNV
jgi:hypothetical protein